MQRLLQASDPRVADADDLISEARYSVSLGEWVALFLESGDGVLVHNGQVVHSLVVVPIALNMRSVRTSEEGWKRGVRLHVLVVNIQHALGKRAVAWMAGSSLGHPGRPVPGFDGG
jgi:hypothetical protein